MKPATLRTVEPCRYAWGAPASASLKGSDNMDTRQWRRLAQRRLDPSVNVFHELHAVHDLRLHLFRFVRSNAARKTRCNASMTSFQVDGRAKLSVLLPPVGDQVHDLKCLPISQSQSRWPRLPYLVDAPGSRRVLPSTALSFFDNSKDDPPLLSFANASSSMVAFIRAAVLSSRNAERAVTSQRGFAELVSLPIKAKATSGHKRHVGDA